MDIALIGAGNVGRALAGSLSRAGHTVTVAARSVENAELVAKETGALAAGSGREAAEKAQVVVLAVGYPQLDAVLNEFGDALQGKVVVDPINRVNPNDPGSTLDGTSVSEHIQARIPEARVVKAFNYAFSVRQADPIVDGTAIDGFVAGDDEEAKAKVLEIVESVGFRPIDAGPLVMARALEAMAVLIITLQIRNGWSWQQGWKLVGPTA